MDKLTELIDNLSKIREDIHSLYVNENLEKALDFLNEASTDILSSIAFLNEVIQMKSSVNDKFLEENLSDNVTLDQKSVGSIKEMDLFSDESVSKVESARVTPVIEKVLDKNFYLIPFSDKALEGIQARNNSTDVLSFLRTHTWTKDNGLAIIFPNIIHDGGYVSVFASEILSNLDTAFIYYFNTISISIDSARVGHFNPLTFDPASIDGYLILEIVEDEPNLLFTSSYFSTTFSMSLIQTSLPALDEFSNRSDYRLGFYRVGDKDYKPYLHMSHEYLDDTIQVKMQNLNEGNTFSLILKYNKRGKYFTSDTGEKYKLCIYSNFYTTKIKPL